MSANKKATSKSAKSPAPATKATPAPAAKASATAKTPRAKTKKTVAIATPAPVAREPVLVPAPAPEPVVAAVAPVDGTLTEVEPVSFAVAALAVAVPPKPVATKPVATTITACIDVGFGNALHMRGEGPGLSWDRGVPMECVAPDQWQISLGESARPFLVKFLVNDLTWSTGPDYTVPSGVNLTLAPQF